tara:strand:+ start:106 stop:501 length:396 start_codon:yes stop_codon:yes gene_type:complete
MGRKKKWSVGQEYNGWTVLSTEPYTTPNGTRRSQSMVECSKCGFQKTVTTSPTRLTDKGCPHYGMGIRKVVPYERVYKRSGDGIKMDERIMLRLDVDMLKTINRLSDEMGLSRSGLIRTALKEYLKCGGPN